MAGQPLPLRQAILIATSAAALIAVSAYADNRADKSGPVLHEDVVPPQYDSSAATRQPIFGPTPRVGQNPSAFANKDKILPEPRPDRSKNDTEPVLGRGGFAADRSTTARPDLHTGSDDTLHYVSVFNPSVLPFKRMS